MSVERKLLKGMAISVAVGGMVIGGVIEGAKRNTSASWADFANLLDSPRRASLAGQMPSHLDEELIKSLMASEKLFIGSKGNLKMSYRALNGKRLEDEDVQINLEDPEATGKMEDLIRDIWENKAKIWDLRLNLFVEWPEEEMQSKMEVSISPLGKNLNKTQMFSVSYSLEDRKTGDIVKVNSSFDTAGVKDFKEDGVWFFRDGEWWDATPRRVSEMKQRFGTFIPSGVTDLFDVK